MSSVNVPIKVLGFAGSLQKNSYNKALLKVASGLLPENVQLEIFDFEGISVFNQDSETKPPQEVRAFKSRIRATDAILIATPEWSYSIPGVLKNAIDRASRSPGDNALVGKPVAITGTSTGILGTARAQYHLRQCFVALNMPTVIGPEVLVAHVDEKVDKNDRLKLDENVKKRMSELIKNLADLTIKPKRT
jgi:chromate reductase